MYVIRAFCYRPPSLIYMQRTLTKNIPRTRAITLLDPYCCNRAYKLRYTFIHIHFRLQVAVFDFSLTLASDSINIRPIVLIYPPKCGSRPLKFHIYSFSNFTYNYFQFYVRQIDFQLNANRILHRTMLLAAAVTSAA